MSASICGFHECLLSDMKTRNFASLDMRIVNSCMCRLNGYMFLFLLKMTFLVLVGRSIDYLCGSNVPNSGGLAEISNQHIGG